MTEAGAPKTLGAEDVAPKAVVTEAGAPKMLVLFDGALSDVGQPKRPPELAEPPPGREPLESEAFGAAAGNDNDDLVDMATVVQLLQQVAGGAVDSSETTGTSFHFMTLNVQNCTGNLPTRVMQEISLV